jgi:pentatricopeptide repeat protein
VFISFLSLSEPFQLSNKLHTNLQQGKCHRRSTHIPSTIIPPSHATRLFTSRDDGLVLPMNEILPLQQLNSVGDLNCEMERLCQAGNVDDALELLNEAEERMLAGDTNTNDSGPLPDHNSYTILMQAWASRDATATPERLEPFLERMKELSKSYPACTPTALTYNAVILTWAKACSRQSGKRCDELMQELRSRYDETSNGAYLPLKATYVSTLAAWASSGRGKEAAERAEAILEEMEGLRLVHPHLAPSTICANIVL